MQVLFSKDDPVSPAVLNQSDLDLQNYCLKLKSKSNKSISVLESHLFSYDEAILRTILRKVEGLV